MATDDESEQYEVDRILADDVVERQKFYSVKWKGYLDEECTWEPVESFASEVSIKQWEREKSDGLGLPDEFLVTLQQRMDAFQARRQEAQFEPPESESSGSEDVEIGFGKPILKQSTISAGNTAAPKSKASIVNKLFSDRGTAVVVKKTQPHNAELKLPPLQTPIVAKPAVAFPRSLVPKDDKAKAPRSGAGEKFRNLKHVNNACKKARTEPAPNIPTSQLKNALEFTRGPDIAHVLSSEIVESNERPDSPLFIPQSNPEYNNVPTSPTPSNGSVFPPTEATHEARASSASDNETLIQGPRTPNNTFRIETAQLPDQSQLITARSGRQWYKGDIVCGFTMGRIIGSARLIHVPDPYRSSLIALKQGPFLTIDFESGPLVKADLEKLFSNFDTPVQALGLIDPFEDQQRGFEKFAQYLEDHDCAALFHHPTANISLLLYSCDARSWTDFGKLLERSGSIRARLHVAFLVKLVARRTDPDLSMTGNGLTQLTRRANVQSPGKSAGISVLPVIHRIADSLSGQSTTVPSIARSVSELIISTEAPRSPRQDVGLSPVSGDSRSTSPVIFTPMAPSKSLFVGANGVPRKASSSARSASTDAGERTSVQTYKSGRSTQLDFDLLIQAHRSVKLERSNPHFFLSFSQSHSREAQMIQNWIERYTAASNVYLESERHGWTRFCDQIEKHPSASVALFYGDEPMFQQLPKLGPAVNCLKFSLFSLTFGGDSTIEPSPASTTARRLFPQGAMYLMTESTILHHPGHALKVLEYFDKNKGPNYRMMMRPNIERWLLSHAAQEPHEGRMHTLLDIIVLIRNLRVAPAGPQSTENDYFKLQTSTAPDAGDEATRYILAPDGLLGYPDMEVSAASSDINNRSTQTKPRLTLEQRDNLLQTYYFYYTAARAHRFRRFLVILASTTYATVKQEISRKTKENDLDCGHIMFWDIEKFIDHVCRREERKACANTK